MLFLKIDMMWEDIMFKKGKVLLTGLVGVSMIFTGCNASSQAGSGKAADAKEVLKTAAEKMNEVESYGMDMTMTMVMEAKDQGTVNMTTDADAKIMLKPELAYQMDSKIDMDVAGEKQSVDMQMYLVKEEDQYTLYTGMMGMWGKASIASAEEAEQEMMQNPAADIEGYLSSIEDISFSGEKTINGIDCQEIKINLTKDYFDDVLGQVDLSSSLGLDEATLNSTLDTLSGVDSLPIYYYVGKESGEMVGYNMDMSELMKKVMVATAGVTEDQLGEFKVSMEIEIKDVNGVSEIVLPEEAKTAMEVSLTE